MHSSLKKKKHPEECLEDRQLGWTHLAGWNSRIWVISVESHVQNFDVLSISVICVDSDFGPVSCSFLDWESIWYTLVYCLVTCLASLLTNSDSGTSHTCSLWSCPVLRACHGERVGPERWESPWCPRYWNCPKTAICCLWVLMEGDTHSPGYQKHYLWAVLMSC